MTLTVHAGQCPLCTFTVFEMSVYVTLMCFEIYLLWTVFRGTYPLVNAGYTKILHFTWVCLHCLYMFYGCVAVCVAADFVVMRARAITQG